MSSNFGGEKVAVTEDAPGSRERSGGGVQAPPPLRPRRRGIGWAQRAEIAALSGPAILMFLAFVIFPVVLAAYYGFYKWKGYGVPTNFVGLDNYKTILQDGSFHDALLHNGMIVVLSLIFQGPIALGFALMLNQQIRGRSVIRLLIFVPFVISEVIVGTSWSLLLQVNGAVNAVLDSIGLSWFKQDWLANPKLAIWTLMIILTWKYIGFAVILFMAGMQNIPDELSEAAAVDGASYWQIQRRITVPLLAPTIRIWGFLSIIGALQLFDLVYIIWGQYVAATAGTSTMVTYMVVEGRNAANYGYGNAVAVVLFVISMLIALVYQRFVLRRDTEGALTDGR